MEESQKNEFVKKIFILMFKLPNMFDVDEYMNSLSKLSGDNLTNFMKGKGTSVYNNDFLKIKDLFYLCDNYSDLSFLSEFLFLKEENVKKQVKYFAAYDGSVRAGIDESIKIEITNEKEHEITIFIPEVKILSCSVDLKADHKNKSVISFDKNAVNSDVFMRESHEAAQKDLSKKVAEDKDLLELAEKNLKSTIESLIKSVIKDKDIKIKYEKIDYTKELSV